MTAPTTLASSETADTSLLFSPFRCKSLNLPNRVVMAPMSRLHSPGGIPTPEVAGYYRRRAENHVGLIITEGTFVDEMGMVDSNAPRFWGDAMEGWKRVAEEVHGVGGSIVPQLWHVGIERPVDGNVLHQGRPSMSPSGIDRNGDVVADPMSDADVEAAIAAFADAAGRARELGFDGIELHAAHGYLIDQFFRELFNKRTDRYGGSPEARAMFGVDVVKAIRRTVGDDFAIIMRVSQWRGGDYDAKLVTSPEEFGAFLTPLSDAGVDIFHCSTRRYFLPEFEGSDLNLAGWAQKLTNKPAITVGGIGIEADFNARDPQNSGPQSLGPLMERLARGEFDLVAVGRALLTDPLWARKLQEGRFDELQGFRREMLGVLS
ncbi:MAG: NADH:flavin oxidoreductase [Sphingobium sp.]